MTTPQVPSNALDASDISDEINPASYVQGQQYIGSNNTVRQLTGQEAKTRADTEILFSDLSNKIGFSEIYSVSSSNTQSGVGGDINPVNAQLTLQANSDMYSPTMDWSYTIESGSENVTANDIVITKPTSKTAVIKVSTASGAKVANLTVTGVMSVNDHVVNTCSKNILLSVEAVNTAFQVTATPSFTVNATGVSAQTATLTVNAIVNSQLSGISFAFTPTFVSGTGSLSPIVGSNSVVFTATAASPGTNSAVYSVKTDLYYQGEFVDSNTSLIDIRAQFVDREITSLTSSAQTNNQFSNTGSQYSSLDITAVHNAIAPTYDQGTITITFEVSGNSVTQQTLSSNSSSTVERVTLYHDFDTDGYGFKKAIVTALATLRSSSGIVIDQKRLPGLELRAGAYGLTIALPQSNTQSGYSAQTATTAATATWRAGDFKWSTRQFNGSGPILTVDGGNLNIIATTPSGKNATQTISNTCNYDITGTLSFDNVIATTQVISDLQIKAESLPYTYSLSTPATSNVQMEVNGIAHPSITISAAKSTGTITWTKNNANVSVTPGATTALAEIDSPVNGGATVEDVIVTGTLYDASSRVIESLNTPQITLDAATSKLQIIGDDVSLSTDQRTATAVGVYETTALAGVHSFIYPPTKKGGNDLLLSLENPQKILITASATQASNSGSYELAATVNYKGIVRRITKEVTVTVNALAPSLTYTKTPYSYYDYKVGFNGAGLYTYYTGEDVVAETNYPGLINVDYSIRQIVNSLGWNGQAATSSVIGPYFNEPANTQPAPNGHPSTVGANKRRDRIETLPLTNQGVFEYNVTYELLDNNDVVLISNNVTTHISVPVSDLGNTTLNIDTTSGKVFTFTEKPTNIYGYPEPYPLTVVYSQTANFIASYISSVTLPTPRFVFSSTQDPIISNSNITIVSNNINGQANVTVSSSYYDIPEALYIDSITSQASTRLILTAQLTSNGLGIGSPASNSYSFDVKMPTGRCYTLSTYSYGVRSSYRSDVLGNAMDQWGNGSHIDYGRVPNGYSLYGAQLKYMGFHGGTTYTTDGGPLYAFDYGDDAPQTRYYSSQSHRNNWIAAYPGEQAFPYVIIPNGYFVVMSFSLSGEMFFGTISLVGADNKVHRLNLAQPFGAGQGGAGDGSFVWYIFRSSVTTDHAFISYLNDGPPTEAGGAPAGGLNFQAIQPGNVLAGQDVNLRIGVVSGGTIYEDTNTDQGTRYRNFLYSNNDVQSA